MKIQLSSGFQLASKRNPIHSHLFFAAAQRSIFVPSKPLKRKYPLVVQLGICALIIMVAGAAVALPPAPIAIANGSCSTIALENQNAGTDAWIITNPANDSDHQIKGYASATSVDVGGDLAFHVSTSPAQRYSIDIYRLGWYGGSGGRLMHQSGTIDGSVQPPVLIDPHTGLIEAPWSADYSLTIPSTWISGVYLAKLTNVEGFENYVSFVVRNEGRDAELLFQRSVTTDQAYNNYPNDGVTGKSLYSYNSYGSNTVSGSRQAVKVSFDRPYAGDGAGLLFDWEIHQLRWLEREGYDVVYSTNIDTHENGAELLEYAGFLSTGHDEYWSKEMRDDVEAARDAGVNIAFFGANAAYAQIRLEPSMNGIQNRTIVSYKNWNIDPTTDTSRKTGLWREIWQREEQKLIGIQYESYGRENANRDYVVNNSSHWIYAGTGFSDGDRVAAIVGYEVDSYDPNVGAATSQSQTILSSSPYLDTYGEWITANSSIYQAPSNAWVFASGTMSWSWALDKAGYEDTRIKQTTANLLNNFIGSAPSGCDPVTVTPVPPTLVPPTLVPPTLVPPTLVPPTPVPPTLVPPTPVPPTPVPPTPVPPTPVPPTPVPPTPVPPTPVPPTPVPPTDTATLVPTETPTMIPTETPTILLTDTPTLVPTVTLIPPTPVPPTDTPTITPVPPTATLIPPTSTLVNTPTVVATSTSTFVSTETPTLVSTSTSISPTDTLRPVSTDMPTLIPTGASIPQINRLILMPTDTPVPLTDTPTMIPTVRPTSVPTSTLIPATNMPVISSIPTYIAWALTSTPTNATVTPVPPMITPIVVPTATPIENFTASNNSDSNQFYLYIPLINR